MNEIQKAELIYSLEKSVNEKDCVYVFGLNGYLECIFEYLEKKSVRIIAILDNDISKQGNIWKEITIISPKDIINDSDYKNRKYIIASKYEKEMAKEVCNLGVDRSNIFCLLKTGGYNLSKEELNQRFDLIDEGKQILEKVKSLYGEKRIIVYTPVSSIGDVYLLSAVLQQWDENTESIYLMTGRAASSILIELGYKRVFAINLQQSKAVSAYCSVAGFDNCGVVLAHTGFLHYAITDRLLTLQGHTWIDNYSLLFGNKHGDLPQYGIARSKEYLCDKYNIVPNKSVVFAPYANTVELLSDSFWEELAESFMHKGYTVFTNVTDNQNEIRKTLRLNCALRDINSVVELAGNFVGLRSGLCDILANCDAKKIIIYPDVKYDYITVFNYYSFERMKVGKKMIELIYKDDLEVLKMDILSQINDEDVCNE